MRKPRKEPYGKRRNPEHFNAKPELAKAYWELYQQGLSTTAIAKAKGAKRNSVHSLLKSHGYELRSNKQLPFGMFEGNKYTLRNTGYYGKTTGDRTLLHRDMWEHHNGKIPEGYDIHHINENKHDNRIENFECINKAEHTKLHQTTKPVRRIDTGEIYESEVIASKSIGRCKGCIKQAIRFKKQSAGTYWEFV